jgi:hypothetical protein
MKTSEGNSLYSYFKQAKLTFYFSFMKSQNRRAEQVLYGGLVTVGGGGVGSGKGG